MATKVAPAQQEMEAPAEAAGAPAQQGMVVVNAAQVVHAPKVVGGDDIFQGNPKIMIKQEFAALECCSCEAKNRYRISVPDGEKEGSNIFLYIDEKSGCCERILCSVNRSLTLEVHQGPTKDGRVVQSMYKPFHCQGCICCRPRFEVWNGPRPKGMRGEENTSKQIGKVEDPCACCAMDQKIKDEKDELLYKVYGSICQIGLCCPCCSPVDFKIKKGDEDVGLISKRPLTFCECIQKTNRLTLEFPPDADPVTKQLVFASTMLVDLEYFEVKKTKFIII